MLVHLVVTLVPLVHYLLWIVQVVNHYTSTSNRVAYHCVRPHITLQTIVVNLVDIHVGLAKLIISVLQHQLIVYLVFLTLPLCIIWILEHVWQNVQRIVMAINPHWHVDHVSSLVWLVVAHSLVWAVLMVIWIVWNKLVQHVLWDGLQMNPVSNVRFAILAYRIVQLVYRVHYALRVYYHKLFLMVSASRLQLVLLFKVTSWNLKAVKLVFHLVKPVSLRWHVLLAAVATCCNSMNVSSHVHGTTSQTLKQYVFLATQTVLPVSYRPTIVRVATHWVV